MRVYRVLPYSPNAAPDEPGGVLFRRSGGKNRADSPTSAYRCLYVADSPSGCIAETFGRFDLWDRELIEAMPASPMVPGSRFALATYELSGTAAIRNLDDAQALLDEHLRPSDVVTRDRAVTQQWSSRIHASGRFVGVSWWSYYDAIWRSIALWNLDRLSIAEDMRLLSIDDADIARAATTIVRRLVA